MLRRLLNSRPFTAVLLLVMVVAPVVLLFLPATAFDNGPPLCLFTIAAGVECPGCGLTRAMMRLIHLDFEGAWALNKLIFIVAPALGIWWLIQLPKLYKKLYLFSNSSTHPSLPKTKSTTV